MSTLSAPSATGKPIDRDSSAYDGESVDATLATTDYVPACGSCRAFRVGTTAGNVVLLTQGQSDAGNPSNTLTIPNVQIGETISIEFVKILKSGTTAVGITAFS